MDSVDIIASRELKIRAFNNLMLAKQIYSYEQIANECGVPLCSLLSAINAHRLPATTWNLIDDGLKRLLELEGD